MVILQDTSFFWIHYIGKLNGNIIGIVTVEPFKILMVALIFDIPPREFQNIIKNN